MNKVTLMTHYVEDETFDVNCNGYEYNISYTVKDGEKCLTHLDGFCGDTSNLFTDIGFDDAIDQLQNILDLL